MKANGSSERLHAALDNIGYVRRYGGRNAAFSDDIGISVSTASRILGQDFIPCSSATQTEIAQFARIPLPYWFFGIDPPERTQEDLVALYKTCEKLVMTRARKRGYSLDATPTPLLLRLIDFVYRETVASGGAVADARIEHVINILGDIHGNDDDSCSGNS